MGGTGFLSCSIVSDIYVFTQWKRTRGGQEKQVSTLDKTYVFGKTSVLLQVGVPGFWTTLLCGGYTKKKCGVFCVLGISLIYFVATARDSGLWDCNPFLYRHTNVDQLDSGIAVHGTDTHQQA